MAKAKAKKEEPYHEYTDEEIEEITKNLEWFHLTRELRRRGFFKFNEGRVFPYSKSPKDKEPQQWMMLIA